MVNNLLNHLTDWMTEVQVAGLCADLAAYISSMGQTVDEHTVLRELHRQQGIQKERKARLPDLKLRLPIRLMRHLLSTGMAAIRELPQGSPFHPDATPLIQAYLKKERRWIIHIPRPKPPTTFYAASFLCGRHGEHYFAVRIPPGIKDVITARMFLTNMKKRQAAPATALIPKRPPLRLVSSRSEGTRAPP